MADRLDSPADKRRWFFRRSSGSGNGFDRLAGATTRLMDSPKFVLYMTIFAVARTFVNLLLARINANAARGAYLFIPLNLTFFTQASYSTSLIMLTRNRQGACDHVVAGQDRLRAERNLADTEYLAREIVDLRLTLQDVVTCDSVCSELRDMLENLRVEIAADATNTSPDEAKLEPEVNGALRPLENGYTGQQGEVHASHA